MAATQPNIIYFFWDNFGWGELGCYGGGVLRGAPTPRIDALATQGLKLLNHNVEAQCTPSRSSTMTGRHAIRSGTGAVALTGADGMTRWEITIAEALSDAGYATGMWGKWHLGSDPEQRSPVDFGFDEAVWCPRTADEVCWPTQSYFPDGEELTARPYAGDTKVVVEPQPIYSRKKGAKSEVLSKYDPEWRAGFDRKITEWACDFMTRSKSAGKPFYLYLPYTQVHNPAIPDPEYVGKTKRGNWADILTQIDDFTGVILDKLDELGVADDTIVVWASDNGPDPTYHSPVSDPDPMGAVWNGFSGIVAGQPVHLARGLEPDAVHHSLAREGPRGQGQQRARPPGRLLPDAGEGGRRHRADRPGDRRYGHDRFPAGRRRGVGPRHRVVHPGRPVAGGQVAPVEAPPVQAGRLLLDLGPVELPDDLQPGMGPTRRKRGHLPARLGDSPHGRRRRNVPHVAGEGAPDQAGNGRSLHPTNRRRVAIADPPADRSDHPVRHGTGQDPRRRAAT